MDLVEENSGTVKYTEKYFAGCRVSLGSTVKDDRDRREPERIFDVNFIQRTVFLLRMIILEINLFFHDREMNLL